jgi:hypothetical protein
MELEKSFSRVIGSPPRFRPTAESRPNLLSACPRPLHAAPLHRPGPSRPPSLPLAPARSSSVPTVAETGRPVPAMRRSPAALGRPWL